MKAKTHEYCAIAQANDWMESIRIQMLLDRARLPYRIVGEANYAIYGLAASTISGPMKFMIPVELKHEAEEIISSLFEVDMTSMPSQCPACDCEIPLATVDCPSCGLFLG